MAMVLRNAVAAALLVSAVVDCLRGLRTFARVRHTQQQLLYPHSLSDPNSRPRRCALRPLQQAPSPSSSAAASLLPDPMPNSIGNFFENQTDSMSFIQCYMLSVGTVGGTQYGVGFPVDMPVMLTYFEGNELKPVREDYPDYDHLMNHVAVQLDTNDFQLYRTPVVLTLQGEFEDDDFNEVIPGQVRVSTSEMEGNCVVDTPCIAAHRATEEGRR